MCYSHWEIGIQPYLVQQSNHDDEYMTEVQNLLVKLKSSTDNVTPVVHHLGRSNPNDTDDHEYDENW